MKDVVCVIEDGFDGGGVETLGKQLHKTLNIPVIYKGKESPFKEISVFQNASQLITYLEKLSPKVIITVFNPKAIIRKQYKGTVAMFENRERLGYKIVGIDCHRNQSIDNKGYHNEESVQNILNELGGRTYDELWSLSGATKEHWSKLTSTYRTVDSNLYKLERKPIENRERTIGYLGRMVGFKGINKFIKTVNKVYNERGLSVPYVHFGSYHRPKDYEEKGIVGGNIMAVGMLAKNGFEDRTPLDSLALKSSIKDELTDDKYNIFTRCSPADMEYVASRIGVAICPTLAREHAKPNNSDNRYIEKERKRWTTGLEYANVELIEMGVPVLFSIDYCLTYAPEMLDLFPQLVYNNLEDALLYAETHYDEIIKQAPIQREWLVNKINHITQTVETLLHQLT